MAEEFGSAIGVLIERGVFEMFYDYKTMFDMFRKSIKSNRNMFEEAQIDGVDPNSYGSYYKHMTRALAGDESKHHHIAYIAQEFDWYEEKRPFFNVYQIIEKKLLEISDDIDISELSLPFKAIEIRTTSRTMLVADFGKIFLFSVVTKNDEHGFRFYMNKDGKVEGLRSSKISDDLLRECSIIACGVCLLAKDPSIVTPVILNRDRREVMTAEELEKYKARAIEQTGKTGFDVGRHMHMNPASSHYRNGCLAKYYVGKTHEMYPANCSLERAPIIKWRSGAVVNANNTPKIPTGFKGNEIESE